VIYPIFTVKASFCRSICAVHPHTLPSFSVSLEFHLFSHDPSTLSQVVIVPRIPSSSSFPRIFTIPPYLVTFCHNVSISSLTQYTLVMGRYTENTEAISNIKKKTILILTSVFGIPKKYRIPRIRYRKVGSVRHVSTSMECELHSFLIVAMQENL